MSFVRYDHSIVVVLLLCSLSNARSQTFTKVTTGALVNDTGAWRSVNWVDYDSDGDLDLFVTSGLRAGRSNLLYRNDGPPDFAFTKTTAGPLVNTTNRGVGSSWGDYDNDGDLDAFITTWYGDTNPFFENTGNGAFTRITTGSVATDGSFSEACSWGDYDNDGDLDLYVSNSGDVNATGPQRNFLYQNNGDKTFTKITAGALMTDLKFSRGMNWVDYDDDGDLDVFVANEENQTNDLYRNLLKENGTVGFDKLSAGNIVTDVASSWSGSWGDYDNDGDLDLFVANWGNQNNALYQNAGNGTFQKITAGVIVNDGGYSASSGWGDYDNDGDLDLYVTNAYGPGPLRNFLYRNLLMDSDTLAFEKIITGPAVMDLGYSYGLSWADYDHDGDLDLFVARTQNENQNNAFYINDGGNQKNWLELSCVGTVSNKSAIGAKVRLKATINGNAIWQRRDVAGQEGYCGQNLRLHFGLGETAMIDSLMVEWPSGNREILKNITTRQMLTITEGSNPTGVHDSKDQTPQGFRLHQNYPNPFNPATQIEFTLPVAEQAVLKIYDLIGDEIRTLAEGFQPAGGYAVTWDGTDQRGQRVAAGVYFCRLYAGVFQQTRKMLFLHGGNF
ncbi:MAG: FG-GAP-like repeat-containing protein [bacterium]